MFAEQQRKEKVGWMVLTEGGRLHRKKYSYGIAETRTAIVMIEGIGKWPFALMGT